MVSSARQAIACILLVFSAFVYARAQSAAEKGLASTITGKVTVKGKGVPGIGVSLTLMEGSNPSMTRHRGITDDQGNYRITNVPPGKYAVTIGAPAFPPADDASNQKTVIVNKNETIEDVNFALMRGGVITGRVTDSDGNPLIEEEVNVIPVNTNNRFYSRYASGRTDDRGIYRIFGVRPGRYTVAAGQDEGLGGVRGRGGYQKTFHPDVTEAANATVIEVEEGAEAKNVDITVGRAMVRYSASGRIIDGETGRPLADVPYGVQMFVSPTSSSSMTTGSVSTKDGEFKLRNLMPGKYAVFIETPPNSEWRADPVHFEVTDQDVTGLTIKSSKGASVSGVVVLEGTNDKAVYAKLIKSHLFAHVMNDREDRGSTPATTINPDGSFRAAGLQAGILMVGFMYGNSFKVVRMERDGVVYARGVEIKEAEQVTGLRVIVSEANGTIRGVVRLEKGTPAANGHFRISVRRVGENDGGQFDFGSNDAETDARGQFVAEKLLPGTYEVTAAYAPDMRTPWRRSKQQVVVSNGVVTNVTLTIDPDAPVPTRP